MVPVCCRCGADESRRASIERGRSLWCGARDIGACGALIGSLVLVGALFAGCGGDDESGNAASKGDGGTKKVRVGMLPISNAAPFYLGIKKGFFEEEGLEAEPVVAQSGNEITTAVLSGDLQFGFTGFVIGMAGVSKGLPLKIVANGDAGAEKAEDEWTVIVVAKDSPIKDVADLAGKTIAVNALKGVGEVAVKAALEKRGVDPDSIKLLEVPFPEMPAALEKDRVDAIWAPEPFLTSVLNTGAREIEAPLTTLGPLYPNGSYVTSERQVGEDEESVAAFTRGRSTRACSTRPSTRTRRGRRSRRSRRSPRRWPTRSGCPSGRCRSTRRSSRSCGTTP